MSACTAFAFMAALIPGCDVDHKHTHHHYQVLRTVLHHAKESSVVRNHGKNAQQYSSNYCAVFTVELTTHEFIPSRTHPPELCEAAHSFINNYSHPEVPHGDALVALEVSKDFDVNVVQGSPINGCPAVDFARDRYTRTANINCWTGMPQ